MNTSLGLRQEDPLALAAGFRLDDEGLLPPSPPVLGAVGPEDRDIRGQEERFGEVLVVFGEG